MSNNENRECPKCHQNKVWGEEFRLCEACDPDGNSEDYAHPASRRNWHRRGDSEEQAMSNNETPRAFAERLIRIAANMELRASEAVQEMTTAIAARDAQSVETAIDEALYEEQAQSNAAVAKITEQLAQARDANLTAGQDHAANMEHVATLHRERIAHVQGERDAAIERAEIAEEDRELFAVALDTATDINSKLLKQLDVVTKDLLPLDGEIIQQIAEDLCNNSPACDRHLKTATGIVNQIKQYYKIGAIK